MLRGTSRPAPSSGRSATHQGELVVSLASDAQFVHADGAQLVQVLVNLSTTSPYARTFAEEMGDRVLTKPPSPAMLQQLVAEQL